MILSSIRQFKHSQAGAAFVEFALSLPVLLVLLMGVVEITRYILIVQKVEKAAMIVSDVSAQGSTISTTDLNNIVTAASQVMQPYGFGANGFVIVSSVTQTGTYSAANPPKVNWQYTSSGANGSWTQPSQIGTPGLAATLPLPAGTTLNDKDNVIVTEIFYNFQPIVSTNGLIGTTKIYRTGLYKPRLGALSTLGFLPTWETMPWRLL
jgi:Flp pilus assembly protein TadG